MGDKENNLSAAKLLSASIYIYNYSLTDLGLNWVLSWLQSLCWYFQEHAYASNGRSIKYNSLPPILAKIEWPELNKSVVDLCMYTYSYICHIYVYIWMYAWFYGAANGFRRKLAWWPTWSVQAASEFWVALGVEVEVVVGVGVGVEIAVAVAVGVLTAIRFAVFPFSLL